MILQMVPAPIWSLFKFWQVPGVINSRHQLFGKPVHQLSRVSQVAMAKIVTSFDTFLDRVKRRIIIPDIAGERIGYCSVVTAQRKYLLRIRSLVGCGLRLCACLRSRYALKAIRSDDKPVRRTANSDRCHALPNTQI